MTIKSMNLSWIVVSDFNEAVKYYTETVGLQLRNKDEKWNWAELQGADGGSVLGIAQANEEMEPGKNAVVTLSVEDIQKSKDELANKQVKFIGDIVEVPGHVKLQLFVDRDGNQMQLVQTLDK